MKTRGGCKAGNHPKEESDSPMTRYKRLVRGGKFDEILGLLAPNGGKSSDLTSTQGNVSVEGKGEVKVELNIYKKP